MTSRTFDHIGIDLNGITDSVAGCSDGAIPTIEMGSTVVPACVIEPRFQGERPLGGFVAFESLHGRGWDEEHRLPRHPVYKLLQQLERQTEAIASASSHGYRVSDFLATHLFAVSQGAKARIIAVPDTLSELGQQRLLDGLRRLGIRAELLWRPVAALLGWSLHQRDDRIRSLHDTRIMVIHAGLWHPEVSVLNLEVEEYLGRALLVPVRHGRGQSVMPSTWRVDDVAREALAAEMRRAGFLPTLAESQVWINRRPWSVLCGQTPPDEILRDQVGRWHRLSGPPDPGITLGDPVFDAFLMLITHAALESRIETVLIEGPLVGAPSGDSRLGDRLAAEAARRFDSQTSAVEIWSPDRCLAATGAAHYGWRRKTGIVGYYDTIPDLKINALVELRPAFISLMEGRDRVIGGETVGMEVGGFSIAEGTAAVDYYLARADEPTVRKTHTALPEPARRTTPVTLVVAQTPGQGFASVEIRPPRGESLGDRPVFLDWSTMQHTGETLEAALARLRKEYGLAFPDPAPFPCHAAVWENTQVVSLMRPFIQDAGMHQAQELRVVLGKKQSLDWLLQARSGGGDKAGIFDSDGQIPKQLHLEQRLGPPPSGFKTYQELVDRVQEITGREFERRMMGARDGVNKELHRQLLLIGGWCYATAPEPVLEYVRRSLRTGDTIHARYDFNVAGRAFYRKEDISLLFRSVAKHFRQRGFQTPFDRIKALSLVLTYRADAPEALDSDLAYQLAEIAATVLENEAKTCNIKKIFFSAAYLLMGLLRYRRIEPGFLDQDRPENAQLAARVKATLKKAERCVKGDQVDQVRGVLKEITAFLEKRGTDALIFTKLDALSE